MSEALKDLLERVEKASGPDRELDRLIHLDLVNDGALGALGSRERWLERAARYDWNTSRYTASVDAVLALIERMLPDRYPQLEKGGGTSWRAWIMDEPEANVGYHSLNPSPALALLGALLRALIAEPA